jgi:tetraacyldisaccharide 4'-kinase
LISNLIFPPLSILYRAITQTRLAAYEKGFFRVTKLDVPVISVGNLTTGGTGKTPVVEWICRVLAASERRVCVLTRGYGRLNPESRVIVSDGSKVLALAAEAGDEPLLLAQNLRGLAAVISDADRSSAGKWAKEELGMDVFVLDDGFQHLRLDRNLDLLVIDATDPWGGGHLLPFGRLREPRGGVARADCIVVTRADSQPDVDSLKKEIRRFNQECPIFISSMNVRSITRLGSGFEEEIASLPQPVAAFCGVGNPQSFLDQLSRAGLDPLFTQSFPDHHWYQQTEIDSLCRKSRDSGAESLITTAKDAVKLQALDFDLPCFVLNIEIDIEEESRLRQLIEDAVRDF